MCLLERSAKRIQFIRRQEDVGRLRRAKVLGPELAQHLTRYLNDIQAQLDDMSPGTYTMEDVGQIVLLEKGDNARDLTELRLSLGLMDFVPEWFEVVALDGINYYCFLVMLGDSFGIVFYSPIGVHDEEVEEWLVARLRDEEVR